jgi:hypothetical protein
VSDKRHRADAPENACHAWVLLNTQHQDSLVTATCAAYAQRRLSLQARGVAVKWLHQTDSFRTLHGRQPASND